MGNFKQSLNFLWAIVYTRAMIEISKIKKSYGKKAILTAASFSMPEGTCTGIIGKNGSGKSTLLSILAGVCKAEGAFFYQGKDLLKEKKLRQNLVAYVPQGLPLFPELTGLDNLLLWYKCRKKDLSERLEKDLLLNLQIKDLLNLKVNKMSGGMKKKLSIACALSENPQILLLDEPTSALDICARMQIKEYLDKFRKAGKSIILVTHNEDEIRFCNQCFMLNNGILSPYTFTGDLKKLATDLEGQQ